MIAQEDDPKQRLILLILNNINNSLVENTKTTVGLANQFEEHLARFDDKVASDAVIFNQGKGMWRVFAWVLGIAQSALASIAVFIAADLNSVHTEMSAFKADQVHLVNRVGKLEKYEERGKP